MIDLARQASGIAQLPGFIADMDEFYAALDVFIMPSRSEAWGLTALRAMAFSLPVLASNAGKGILPDSHPLSLSCSVLQHASREALADADVVLLVGSEVAAGDHFLACRKSFVVEDDILKHR